MRKDIKDSTRFTLTEFLHMLGLERNKVVRIIAREWLILLGIIAVGILIILFGYSTKFIPVKLTISLFKDTDAAILVKYALMVQILNFGRLVAVYGYPVYLLIRFIIWAIKTLREK